MKISLFLTLASTGPLLSISFILVNFCQEQETVMLQAISSRDLSEARFVALEAVQAGCPEDRFAKLYRKQADELLASNHTTVATRRRTIALVDEDGCWNFDPRNELDLWDQCCSQFWSAASGEIQDDCLREGVRMCCEVFVGSSSYLRLPALQELALRVRVRGDDGVYETYDLEQDGFLRKYDTASVLWPTGNLLGLCVAAPKSCGIPELNDAIAHGTKPTIELAGGVGLPSIALARLLGRMGNANGSVVVTDNAPHALALTETNARAANASVTTAILDFYNWNDISKLRDDYNGFSIILGSALQSLFIEPTEYKDHHLWKILDALLDHSSSSIVVLAHTINQLMVPPDGMFQRIRTISGNQFGMKSRWDESSDFEISVFRRASKHENSHVNPKEEL